MRCFVLITLIFLLLSCDQNPSEAVSLDSKTVEKVHVPVKAPVISDEDLSHIKSSFDDFIKRSETFKK